MRRIRAVHYAGRWYPASRLREPEFYIDGIKVTYDQYVDFVMSSRIQRLIKQLRSWVTRRLG